MKKHRKEIWKAFSLMTTNHTIIPFWELETGILVEEPSFKRYPFFRLTQLHPRSVALPVQLAGFWPPQHPFGQASLCRVQPAPLCMWPCLMHFLFFPSSNMVTRNVHPRAILTPAQIAMVCQDIKSY